MCNNHAERRRLRRTGSRGRSHHGRPARPLPTPSAVASATPGTNAIRDVVFPYENERVNAAMGVDTKLTKVLVHRGEWMPGRTTVIIIREPVGV